MTIINVIYILDILVLRRLTSLTEQLTHPFHSEICGVGVPGRERLTYITNTAVDTPTSF